VYPNTDAQYTPAIKQPDGLGDPVYALCGGGEAALHSSSLYPASDAHLYNVDQQLQVETLQDQQLQDLQGTGHASTSLSIEQDPECSGSQMHGYGWQGGAGLPGSGRLSTSHRLESGSGHYWSGGGLGNQGYREGVGDVVEERETQGAGMSKGNIGSAEDQGSGEDGAQGLIGLLASYGSDDSED